MRECRTSGSVGAPGEQLPGATQPSSAESGLVRSEQKASFDLDQCRHVATVMPAACARRAGRTTISTCWSSDTSACISRSSDMFCSL